MQGLPPIYICSKIVASDRYTRIENQLSPLSKRQLRDMTTGNPSGRKQINEADGHNISEPTVPVTFLRLRSHASPPACEDARNSQLINESAGAESVSLDPEAGLVANYRKIASVLEFVDGPITAKNIRREAEVYAIPWEEIGPPPWPVVHDEIFMDLYVAYDRGQISAYVTRLPEADVLIGFYEASDPSKLMSVERPEDIVQASCDAIRRGERPTIWVRENFDIPNAPRFFCSDSVTAMLAYRRLGVSLIPAAIVSKAVPVRLPHSALEMNYGGKLKDTSSRVAAVRACKVEEVPGHMLDELSLHESLSVLRVSVERAITRLQKFHADNVCDQLHYHDTLYSTLIRTRDYLSGADLLLNAGLSSQAVSLYRSLYELHLNFYIDWLAPETSYIPLSFAARTDRRTLKKIEERMVENYLKKRSRDKAEELAKRALFFIRWLGLVSNRAMASPVGIALHENYYGYLSSILHQDFEETANHANQFRAETYQTVDERTHDWIRNFVNIVVTGTLTLVEGDIG